MQWNAARKDILTHFDTCLTLSDLTYPYRTQVRVVHTPCSSHSPLLSRSLNARHKPHPILNIYLHIHTPPQSILPIIQRPGLNSCNVRHDIRLAVETGAAVGAEEVAVVFAGLAGYIAVFGAPFV